MAYFVNFASKFERALRALLILQNKATWAECFVANDSRIRVLPNRTFVVRQFNPTRAWRPEGVCQAEIQHHFVGAAQPNQQETQPRVNFDTYLGETLDTLNLGGASEATDMKALADAITQAGRWLATNNPNGNSPTDAQIVADNADMANFRCDWVKFSEPLITRGNDANSTNWVEIVHLSAFVSHSTLASN